MTRTGEAFPNIPTTQDMVPHMFMTFVPVPLQLQACAYGKIEFSIFQIYFPLE